MDTEIPVFSFPDDLRFLRIDDRPLALLIAYGTIAVRQAP
jgi:hypothetical protein